MAAAHRLFLLLHIGHWLGMSRWRCGRLCRSMLQPTRTQVLSRTVDLLCSDACRGGAISRADARLEARWLLDEVRARHATFHASAQRDLDHMIARRRSGEPVAYGIGAHACDLTQATSHLGP